MKHHVDQATAKDTAAVAELLRANDLPTEGIGDAALFVLRREGNVVACAAVEHHGPYALLRSVAVVQDLRNEGLGQVMTEAALAYAREKQARAVYLLTLTADKYFPKFGFEVVRREDVPLEVTRSSEFSRLCPDSAVVMFLKL